MALTKVTYPDSDNLILGTGNDLYLYHDGSNSYISDLGTGDFKLTTNGAKISLQKGTTETLANFIPDGACELYHDNTKVFETISWGVQIIGGKVTGDFIFDNGSNAGKDITWDESDDALEFADNTKATFGTDTDLEIYHTGSDGVIYNKTGDLFIYGDGDDIFLNATNAKTGVWVKPDAAVELRYDNVKKFETTAAGATVTGTLTADLADDSIDSEHYVDGSIDAAHLSDDAVATAKIQNNAVTSAKIGTNQVTSVEIADDAVGADQLAAGALQTEHCGDNQISEAKLQVSNSPTNGYFLSAQSGNTGGLTWAEAGGTIKEQFYSPCDGSAIALDQGSTTLGDVTSSHVPATSFADVPGSTIAYVPPSGTTNVIYEFSFIFNNKDSDPYCSFIFYIDSDEVTQARLAFGGQYAKGMQTFKWGINIGGTADTTAGRLASWTSSKTLKLQAIAYSNTREAELFTTGHWTGPNTSGVFNCPRIGITAI